jgi:tRNA dimethylallyltransferase
MTTDSKNNNKRKLLLTIVGPTAVGKTTLAIQLAQWLDAPILSADSRQMFRQLPIGTAAPTTAQRQQAKFFFTGFLELDEYYSAGRFEQEAMALLNTLFESHHVVILAGGAMLYVDALCYGIDEIPDVNPAVRATLWNEFYQYGLPPLLDQLKLCDPILYQQVDQKNYKRVIHALEDYKSSGNPLSQFKTHTEKKRPFDILRIGLDMPRNELFQRINQRVEAMIDNGLVEEAAQLLPFRHLNSLNTVGYKEIFQYLDGTWNLDTATEKIKRNTRIYAKKQLTWFKHNPNTQWFHPRQIDDICQFIEKIYPNLPHSQNFHYL